MNSLYGVQLHKGINELYKRKSEHWMQTEYDDNVLHYWSLSNGNYIVKMKKDDGSDGDNDEKNTIPSHLGSFILSIRKRIRFCTDKLTCNNCNNQLTENKNFEAKLNFLNEKPLINLVICFLIIKNDICDICFLRMIPCTSQIRIILLKRIFSFKKIFFNE